MTRETKVGLLAGMALILLIGILVSDELSKPGELTAPPIEMAGEGSVTGAGVADGTGGEPIYVEQPAAVDDQAAPMPTRSNPIPVPEELPLERPAHGSGEMMAEAPAEPPPFPATGDLATAIKDTPFLPAHRVEYRRKRYHTVKQGEYLSHIADRYYTDPGLWQEIRDANPGKVAKDGQVRQGVRLVIPFLDDQEDAIDEPAPSRRSATRSRARTITAKAGDTLGALASKHLGSSRDWPALLDANRKLLDAPEDLQVGMKLRLPAAQTEDEADEVDDADDDFYRTPARRRRGAPNGKPYKVRHGDTLSSLADRFLGDSAHWYELYRANQGQIDDPDVLRPGTELLIPRSRD